MRRGLASLIMGLSLLVASASWAAFILSHTLLDPGRSETLADTLLDNEAVRAVIVDRLADAVESQIPASVPVSRDTVELGAEIALDDPRIEAVVRDGIVRTHQNALAGIDEPVTLDASAIGAVGRESVVGVRPELDSVLPAAPTLAVELPGSGLSWLGRVKQAVDRFTQVSAAIALIGVTAAFVMARNRAAALRRVAFWAFGASLFWVAAAYGIPALLDKIAPSSVSIATAMIDIFFGAMVRPALIMAGAGVTLLLLSFVWPALARRRPAAMVNRPTPARGALEQGLPVLEGTVRQASPSVGVAAPVRGYPPTETVPIVGESMPMTPVGGDNRFHPDDVGPHYVADSRQWLDAPAAPPSGQSWPDAPAPPPGQSWADAPPSVAEGSEAAGGISWPDADRPTTHRPDRRRLARPVLDGSPSPDLDRPGDEPVWVEGVGYVDHSDSSGDTERS